MLNQCLVPSIIKKSHFLLVGSGTTATYSPSNAKFLLKYFNISSNHQKHFYFQTSSIVIQIRQNNVANFDLTTESLNEKY